LCARPTNFNLKSAMRSFVAPRFFHTEEFMKGFIGNIEERTELNGDFRRVLYTGQHLQLVLMSLDPGEDIGEEVHDYSIQVRIPGGFEYTGENDDAETSLEDGIRAAQDALLWLSEPRTCRPKGEGLR